MCYHKDTTSGIMGNNKWKYTEIHPMINECKSSNWPNYENSTLQIENFSASFPENTRAQAISNQFLRQHSFY